MSRRLSRRNTRVLALMFAVICLSIGCLASPASADTADFSIVIDGVEVDSDESPRIENDRIVVPIRVVSESLGREVEWLAHTRQILVLGDGAQSDEFVLLTIGENLALLNGEEVELDVAPFIVPASGRALVPLRFVAEAFGSEVDWDAEDRTAIIASGRPEEEPEGAGGPGEGPDEVLGYEMTSHGLELDVSGTFEWMTVRDSPDIVILRLTGTQLGEDVPPMQAFDEGPIARVSLSSGEGTDESVYLSVSLREELTRRIEATDSGLSMELAYLESVEIVTDDGGPRVMLRTTIPVDVRTFTLKEPARAVVDLFGTEWADATTSEEFEDDILRSVRFGRHRESVGDLFSGTRMVLDLAEYRVPVISTRERDDHFEIAVGVRTSSIAGKVVALDPGHGGLDPGAQGVQVPEKEVNLLISEKITDVLRGAGATVVTTRDIDCDVAIYDRPAIANAADADVFLSIHANADPRGVAEGTETYHYPNHDSSERLAETLHHQLINALGSNDRGVRYGNFAVLREAEMPAALLECLYLSSSGEEARLMDPIVQEAVAQAVLAALEQFFAN